MRKRLCIRSNGANRFITSISYAQLPDSTLEKILSVYFTETCVYNLVFNGKSTQNKHKKFYGSDLAKMLKRGVSSCKG